MELREVSVPEIGDDDVLLRVGAVSVCGSDVHQAYNTQSWPVNVPVTLGHEFGGTVAKAGRAVKGFREGDRVVSETAAEICGECLLCRTGRYNLCPDAQGIRLRHRRRDGVVRQGRRRAASTRFRTRCRSTLACLAEPHAVAYNAMCVNSTIRPGDLVVVLGPGPIGLLCARMAALAGADPLIVVGLSADAARLETATRLGATRVVNAQARERRGDRPRVQSARRRSRVRRLGREPAARSRARAGASRRPGDQGRLVAGPRCRSNINPLVQKNIRLQGSFSHNFPIWERVIHLLDRRSTLPDEIVGLTSPLDGWREAFDAMHEGRVIKSVLVP